MTIESLAHGGAGVGRAEAGFVVFVRGVVPGDRVRAQIDKAKRSFAEARVTELLEPSPDRIEPRAAAPRCAVAGASLRAPAGDQAAAGGRRADPPRRLRGPAGAGRSCPRSSSGTTATSSSTRSARPTTATSPGVPPRRPLGPDRPGATTTCWPPSASTRCASRCWPGAGSRAERLRPRGPRRLPAQPRGARGSADGPDPGPAGHQQGRVRPGRVRGGDRRRLGAVDAGRGRRRDHARRQDAQAQGPEQAGGGAHDRREHAAFQDLARRLLPDQHRDGGAPLRRRPSRRPG